jgi:hypothetical protein
MATCVFTGPRAQDCSPDLCLCQALGRTPESLTQAEEMALSKAVTHWASDPIASEDAFEPRHESLILIPGLDSVRAPLVGISQEWENISDSDAGDVNLSEVWQDGEHHLRTEAMHEKLALGECVPVHGSFPDMCDEDGTLLPKSEWPAGGDGANGEHLGTFTPDPIDSTVEIVNMGEKFIHARTPFGDAYGHPKLTSIVKSHGGVGSIIHAKIVKSDPTKNFPWKMTYLTPASNAPMVTEVKVIRMGKKFILGDVNGEKVWIDPKMTKLIRSFDTDVFKMKLVKSDHGFPWKATFVHPPAPA